MMSISDSNPSIGVKLELFQPSSMMAPRRPAARSQEISPLTHHLLSVLSIGQPAHSVVQV